VFSREVVVRDAYSGWKMCEDDSSLGDSSTSRGRHRAGRLETGAGTKKFKTYVTTMEATGSGHSAGE
jgi:hypothetical protein